MTSINQGDRDEGLSPHMLAIVRARGVHLASCALQPAHADQSPGDQLGFDSRHPKRRGAFREADAAMSTDRALQEYLDEAASWDTGRAVQAARGAVVAWRVAAAGWLCAIASSAALAVLIPLKSVEPYLIRVDHSTGIVDVVPVYTGHAALGEAVTRYFLAHYLTVCERFDDAFAESDYQECGAFNSARLNQAMYAKWNKANPSSPLNVHKDGSTDFVRIESISFFRRTNGMSDLAQVRYARIERQGDGAPGRISYWIANIEYRYGKPPDDVRTRGWNPLGFEVLDLRIEPEVLGTDQEPASR